MKEYPENTFIGASITMKNSDNPKEVRQKIDDHKKSVIDHKGNRIWDGQGRLMYLSGENIMGEFGIFADYENGLCEHERVKEYCDDCKQS